jgi:hypothetical protein
MARFAEDSGRLVELVGTGLSMTEACDRMGLSYGTARKWVDQGRRRPASAHGQFVAALDAARSPATDEGEPGAVERQVEALLRGRDLTGEAALNAAQARTLARAVDELGRTRGAAAKMALATASRRLGELIPALGVPREDSVDRLRKRRDLRRAAAMQSNGRGSGELELEGERRP